ncbi:MAG: hypothetical protein Q4B81_05785 [Moraxella sp.]|nr:hypothetical protein [Moraxella sp.]
MDFFRFLELLSLFIASFLGAASAYWLIYRRFPKVKQKLGDFAYTAVVACHILGYFVMQEPIFKILLFIFG